MLRPGTGALRPSQCWTGEILPIICGQRTNMAFDREQLKVDVGTLAAQGVFVGTSSWKYPGWRGQLYDEAKYIWRGKFSEARFDRLCLAEYAQVFKTVCVDAAYYTFPTPPYH
jgi:hypothetical protein